MKYAIVLTFFISCTLNTLFSQAYQFKSIIDIDNSSIKSQGHTGTCWSFSTTSFLESEILRIKNQRVDLSEMYTVRNTYPAKASNYIYRQGKTQFSEGGLAHDLMNSVQDYGIVPEANFSGLSAESKKHNHAEMFAVLKGVLDVYIDKPSNTLSEKWKLTIESILDVYLGKNVSSFSYNSKKFTPQSFAKEMGIVPSNYITISSFTHAPMYKPFILNIPDNFSNGIFYNVSLDELVSVVDNALEKGFTVELDCDVSEKTFSSKNGIAFIPDDQNDTTNGLTKVVKEKEITAEYRQKEFENYHTTDDHLMHIVGKQKDQNGNVYYKVKNSWGSKQGNGGYVYMSIPYFKLKTISVLVHKDAIPANIATKIN